VQYSNAIVNKHFPVFDPAHVQVTEAATMKSNLLAEIELLGNRIPLNTLDELMNHLGGPDKVAEMTERQKRQVKHENGQVVAKFIKYVVVILINCLIFSDNVRVTS
jgi:hypothetical protein